LSRIGKESGLRAFRRSPAMKRNKVVMTVKGSVPNLAKHAEYLRSTAGGKPIYFQDYGIVVRPGDSPADINRQIKSRELDVILVRGIAHLMSPALRNLLNRLDSLAHAKKGRFNIWQYAQGWHLKRSITSEMLKDKKFIRLTKENVAKTSRLANKFSRFYVPRHSLQNRL
jgi:hypothetical protein